MRGVEVKRECRSGLPPFGEGRLVRYNSPCCPPHAKILFLSSEQVEGGQWSKRRWNQAESVMEPCAFFGRNGRMNGGVGADGGTDLPGGKAIRCKGEVGKGARGASNVCRRLELARCL